MRLLLFQVLVLSFSLMACSVTNVSQTNTRSEGIQFESPKKFEDVLLKARANNKLVFVEFYADWCAPCKLMEKEVFSDKTVGEYFNKNFVNVKVDTESRNGPDIAGIFQVNALPTLLFLDDIGKVIERREGTMFQEELIKLAESALVQRSAIKN